MARRVTDGQTETFRMGYRVKGGLRSFVEDVAGRLGVSPARMIGDCIAYCMAQESAYFLEWFDLPRKNITDDVREQCRIRESRSVTLMLTPAQYTWLKEYAEASTYRINRAGNQVKVRVHPQFCGRVANVVAQCLMSYMYDMALKGVDCLGTTSR